MNRRILPGLVVAFAVLAILGGEAMAQRMEQTAYLRPRVGLSSYFGDNEKSPFNFNGDAFDEGFPYSLGLEAGYQFNPRYSLGLGVQFADYPIITQFVNGLDVSDHSTTRTSVQLIARYLLSEGKVAPYVHAGAHVTFGDVTQRPGTAPLNDQSETAFGPLLGAGLDVMVSRQASFFVEWTTNFAFGDDKVDARDDNGLGGFDWLNAASVGFKINLKSPFVPAIVQPGSVTCPAGQVETGQEVTFSGAVNADATQPVATTWDFGDGGSGTGLSAAHAYDRAGTYTVVLSADNGRGASTGSCSVTVVPACVPAEIVTMTASTTNPDTETPVQFNANVQGLPEITYRWDFGDGSTSTSANPTHTFSQPGTYTVTLEATNCGGTTRRTLTVTVVPVEVECVVELNAAFFGRNSSTLTTEARAQLQENLQILLDQPNTSVRIEGFAAPGERRPQGLSEDRARAVEQFYVDNGVAASRLTTAGMGRVTGVTSKKEGTAQYRRADSLPSCN